MSARPDVAEAGTGGLVPDAWLSARMDVPAFTLPSEVDPGLRPPVRPAFLQTKVAIDASDRIEALIRAGYALVETAVTLEMPIRAIAQPSERARFAAPSDASSVQAIALGAFTQSRFHMDAMIPARMANRIKEDWAGNFFAGTRGTHMVVAPADGETAGFLLLIHRGEELIIDLVAVSPKLQGQGLGRAMLDFAARRIAGPRRFVVGTQLHNIQSLAFYTGYGFRIVRASHSLHRHVS